MTSAWRMVVGAFGLVALAIGFLSVVFLTAPAAPGPDLARSKNSAKGLYALSIAPEAGEPRQGDLHAWVVTVKTRQGAPVEGAEIAIGGGMPEHAHGLPTSPEATAYLGDGRYRIEGMKFSMTGWWQLKFGITAPAGADEATFNLVL
ncbi:FixH family protein [Aminobacter anthyllidis]|uniref:FixH family protein n=1 Tax=Aminobacter anthyllidis TaxID=1035067 RepID=A0A9X1AA64_9HYPH|nr:FixH family protein [Aminobacter anthyllidis]MBT1155983.1 FixH family protein [Aminobacter anthyllidis]